MEEEEDYNLRWRRKKTIIKPKAIIIMNLIGLKSIELHIVFLLFILIIYSVH